jgi:hypothetical protein
MAGLRQPDPARKTCGTSSISRIRHGPADGRFKNLSLVESVALYHSTLIYVQRAAGQPRPLGGTSPDPGDYHLKLRLWAAVFFGLLQVAPLNAQQELGPELQRASRFGLKVGLLDGLGVDLTIGSRCGLDATTSLLMSSMKARVYLFDKDTSPFLAVGYGSMIKSLADGGEYSYVLVGVGVEHASEHLFIQGSVHFPFNAGARKHLALIPSFSVGHRF